MSDSEEALTAPDGIRDEHARPITGWRRHASPLSLAVFGVVIALSLLGVLGHERDWRGEGNGVSLVVHAPETIRNGEFFETRISVESDRRIGEMLIGLEQALWEDVTVNTMIPAAAEEESVDGAFTFRFAELDPGTPFLLKIDLQINPDIVGGNEGRVTVYDGDEILVETMVSMTVLP